MQAKVTKESARVGMRVHPAVSDCWAQNLPPVVTGTVTAIERDNVWVRWDNAAAPAPRHFSELVTA